MRGKKFPSPFESTCFCRRLRRRPLQEEAGYEEDAEDEELCDGGRRGRGVETHAKKRVGGGGDGKSRGRGEREKARRDAEKPVQKIRRENAFDEIVFSA